MVKSTRIARVAGQALEHTTRPVPACAIIVPRTPQRRHVSSERGRRSLHSTASDKASISMPMSAAPHNTTPPSPTLDRLPLSQILRTYLITSISSSPLLLDSSSALLRRMIAADSALLNAEKNPVLRAVLWETFYKQFCAGETAEQIAATCSGLRAQGYAGIILEYALEVLSDGSSSSTATEAADIQAWRDGMLRTIDMSSPGDFVGLKWSGMGAAALRRLARDEKPTSAMLDAMHESCEAAAKKNIALLPAAEETSTLTGFHNWSLDMQRQYNRKGKSVVYNTYQAYLKHIPETLGAHLAAAKEEGFTLGVKLVRGAYLATEKRDLIHPTIEKTHAAYDEITSSLIRREWDGRATPDVNVVLATHNAETVRKAREARAEQARSGREVTPLCFAQLQGMADEVSCDLLASGGERVFKCATWGTMTECLNYLLRRAAENKDAASRTVDTRVAMRREIGRRARGLFA